MARLHRFHLALALMSCAGAAFAEPAARLQGVADKDLRAEIVRAIGEAKSAPSSRLEARRRARQAASDATALLRSEGYYESAAVADVSETDPAQAEVAVTPGPRFVLAGPTLSWQGIAPSAAARAAAAQALGLQAGMPGRAADIVIGEAKVVALLDSLGYADAAAEPREVIVDHADKSVRPDIRIRAGAVARLGNVTVEGGERTRSGFVRKLAPWRRGDIYSPGKLAKFERRLTDTGVYDSASASLGAGENGVHPVIVKLVDRPPRTIELGAAFSTTAGAGFNASAAMGGSSLGAYSTIEGSGVDAKWIHYNLLGVADTATVTARLYDIQQVLDLELDLPDWRRPDQILKTGLVGLNERTPAYDDTGVGLRASVERHWSKTTYVSVGAYIDYVSLSEKDAINPEGTPVGEKLNLVIPTAILAGVLDRSNDALDPTQGWRAQLRFEPTFVTGTRQVGYLKALGQVTGYLPLGARAQTVLAGRIELGSIVGGAIPAVPADRRFYSGGGGSVRGYAYQGVGPRLADNTPEGGLSLAEASVELRHNLSAQWGVAAFVDVGTVSLSQIPDFKAVSYGAGVGVRYNLGFGPIRLDVATPLNPRRGDAPVQVYVSIGQSF